MKAKDLVTRAEHSYNRIGGYLKDENDGNSEYWKNQLPFYQKTIDLHKAQVQEVIENLAQKGIDVTQIEYQTKSTEDKIAELDKKLEELPETRENLVTQYKIEKEAQLITNANNDYIGERAEENDFLFKAAKVANTNENEINNHIKRELNEEYMHPEKMGGIGRKR